MSAAHWSAATNLKESTMKTTIPALDCNADITMTSERGLHIVAIAHKGYRERTFTSRRAALAWIREQVGRVSLRRSC